MRTSRRLLRSFPIRFLPCLAFNFAACGGSSTEAIAPVLDAATADIGADPAADGALPPAVEHFSFFIASLAALQKLSGNPLGFGGDLRFGKEDGLSGGDEICRQIAQTSMPGNVKTWRAFLSVTRGPDGNPVNAIDRVGDGPWYDSAGRLLAANKQDLAQIRPRGADAAIYNDLPNENGTPNHNPDGTGNVDNHDMLTGASSTGTLFSSDWAFTCHDWTSAVGTDGTPRCGHPWPTGAGGGGFPLDGGFPGGGFPFDGGFPGGGRDGGFPGGGGFDGGFPGGDVGDLSNWMSALTEAGCAPGVNIVEMGPPDTRNRTVGSGGGYGGFYCFALTP